MRAGAGPALAAGRFTVLIDTLPNRLTEREAEVILPGATWAEKAGSFEVDKVRAAYQSGLSFNGPGGKVTSQKNMHVTKNVFIGETKADGQF